MFSLFKFNKNVEEYVKYCTVYLPRKGNKAIIAASYNHGGLYVEYSAISHEIDSQLFEQTIKKQFDACLFKKDFNYSTRKKSDWPSFEASKYKTIKSFEKDYLRYTIIGANEKNIIISIESSELPNGIRLESSISYFCKSNELCELLLRIHQFFLKIEEIEVL